MYYDDELNRKWLQAEFLAVVGEIVPDVCPDLCGDPFRLYKGVAPFAPVEWDRLQSFDTPQIKALCNSVEEWANRWNLTADWCKDAACFLLYSWTRSGTPGTAFPHPGYKPDALVYFMERYPPPEGFPTYQHEFGRKAYLDDIKNAAREECSSHPLLKYGDLENFIESIIVDERLEDSIEKYCALVEAELRRFTPKERRKLARHLEWAVQHRVLGKSYSRLSREAGVNKENVSRRVREVLTLIVLP